MVFAVVGFSVVAGDIKIGVVNTDKILRESIPAIKAQNKIDQEFISRDEQNKKMAARAKMLQQQLEQDSLTITDSERRERERKLASLSREYQRAQRQMREDFSERQNDEYSLILEKTNIAIERIAKEEKYDLILQLQDSVYRSERIDITDQVIKELADQ